MNKSGAYIIFSVAILVFVVGLVFLGKSLSSNPLEIGSDFETYQRYSSLSKNFTFSEPEEVDVVVAISALIEAEGVIESMESNGLSTSYVSDILLVAKRSLIGHNNTLFLELISETDSPRDKEYLESLVVVAEETPLFEIERLDYISVVRLTEQIKFTKDRAYDIGDYIFDMKGARDALTESVDVDTVNNAILKVEEAFNDERYSDAIDLIGEAEVALDNAKSEERRVKGLVNLSKNFVERNWWKIALVFILLFLLYKPTVRAIKINLTKKKIQMMKLEMETLKRLLKKAQTECFRDMKISEDTYKIREERYMSRLNQIKHKLPVLESFVRGDKDVVEKNKKKKAILEFKR